MLPEIWGAHLWFMLHLISFEYPENPTEYDKRVYHDFYTALKDVIPCEICKKHYRTHIHKHPLTPHLDRRSDLIQWVIDVHNVVNASLGKMVLTTQEVMAIYSKLKPVSPFATLDTDAIVSKYRDKDFTRTYFFIIIAALIIIGVRYYFNRYYFTM